MNGKKTVRVLCLCLWMAVLLSSCSNRSGASPEAEADSAPIQWMIVDTVEERLGWNGQAMDAVFSGLEERPQITRYTGDQSISLSRLLAQDRLPDLITVPAGSALSEKLIGSGRLYGMRELSPALYDSVPEDIRRYYQGQEADLMSLPGGYTAENYRPVAVEGLYVREEYYSLLDYPSMDTLEGLCSTLEKMSEMVLEHQLISNEKLLPLVFGVENSGFSTVEHLCGVRPLYQEEGNTYHRAFSPKIQQVLAFFDALDPFDAYPIFDEYSASRLTELLKSNVLAYIGPSDFIENFNAQNPHGRYVNVTPPAFEDGFLEAQSRYGLYETFVSRNCDPNRAANLLIALSSAQASRTFMYGLEDKHWVMVDGQVTPLKGTLKRLQEDLAAFWQQTGIAAFPFLSRDGEGIMQLRQGDGKAQDLTLEKYYLAPTNYYYYYVSAMDKRLKEYYGEVASVSIRQADIVARIAVLSEQKEPLVILH